MRLSKALIDMEMADYSAALDPAYTTLEFENMQVLAMGNGESPLPSPLAGWDEPGTAGGEVPGMATKMFLGREGVSDGELAGENRAGRAELSLG